MAFTLETYALTQVNDVKSIIDIAAGTTTWDQTFIELTNGATQWIENYLGGRRLGYQMTAPTYTEYFDCDDSEDDGGTQKWIYLKNFPVVSITSIKYRTGQSTYTAFDSTAYETYTERGGIYFYGGIPKGKKVIEVVYTAGYRIDWTTQGNHTLPHDLTLACRKMVLKEFSKRKAQGLTAESVGGASISWNENVGPDILEILGRYKRAFL